MAIPRDDVAAVAEIDRVQKTDRIGRRDLAVKLRSQVEVLNAARVERLPDDVDMVVA